jgi:hypothetical protein
MKQVKKKSCLTPKGKGFINHLHQSSYLQVNIIIAGIIILIMIYSGIYSSTGFSHPIQSFFTTPVASTGLSRAFSEILRGNFQMALSFNPHSIKIFSFFFFQLILRFLFSVLLIRNVIYEKRILFIDVLVTVLLFLWSFYSLIAAQLAMI